MFSVEERNCNIIVSEAVLKVIITDEDQNNVQVEFNAGKVPLDAIIVSLEMVLERLKEPHKSQDRRNIN